MTKNAIQNFQIPVTDFDRAITFYSKIMGYKLEEMEFQDVKLGVFKSGDGGVSGNIIFGNDQQPSKDGSLIYLHCNSDLNEHLRKVEKAGGDVHIKKTELGPNMGFFAIIHDTEGNRIGLFSQK
jgi:predicted enzyme related to lactoylglutathione lyase